MGTGVPIEMAGALGVGAIALSLQPLHDVEFFDVVTDDGRDVE